MKYRLKKDGSFWEIQTKGLFGWNFFGYACGATLEDAHRNAVNMLKKSKWFYGEVK